MAEVIIELELNRRSGVLASAIAALRRLSLSHASQQLLDQAGSPRLILTSEGRVDSLAEVEAVYSSVRGVAAVIDVRVQGVSLRQADEEAAAAIEAAQAASVKARSEIADREPAPDSARQAIESTLAPDKPDQVESVEAADPERDGAGRVDEDGDGFSEEAFARHVLVDAESDQPGEAPLAADGAGANDDQPDGRGPQSAGGLKSTMFRRRRRLR